MKVVLQFLLAMLALAGIALFGLYYLYGCVPAKVEPELSGQLTRYEFEWSGLQRSFLLYKPDKLNEEIPLLLVLHGSRGSGEQIRRSVINEFDLHADRVGFLVAYPTGFENHWNDCRANASYSANQLNIDDIGFKKQFKIFNKVKKNNLNFIVINADNILINPNKTIKKLCRELKIRFSKKMLSWPKGKRSSDGIWSKVWYKNVELSNTFSKYRKEKINVPKKYKKIYEESLKYYNEMNQYSI